MISDAFEYVPSQQPCIISPPNSPSTLGNSPLAKQASTLTSYSSISSVELKAPVPVRNGQCPLTMAYRTDPRLNISTVKVGSHGSFGLKNPGSGSFLAESASSSHVEPPKSQSHKSRVVPWTRKFSGRKSLCITPRLWIKAIDSTAWITHF